MSIARQIECDIKDCNKSATEPVYGDGWFGWGKLEGKQNENDEGKVIGTEFSLCPNHLDMIFEYIKNLSGGR